MCNDHIKWIDALFCFHAEFHQILFGLKFLILSLLSTEMAGLYFHFWLWMLVKIVLGCLYIYQFFFISLTCVAPIVSDLEENKLMVIQDSGFSTFSRSIDTLLMELTLSVHKVSFVVLHICIRFLYSTQIHWMDLQSIVVILRTMRLVAFSYGLWFFSHL